MTWLARWFLFCCGLLAAQVNAFAETGSTKDPVVLGISAQGIAFGGAKARSDVQQLAAAEPAEEPSAASAEVNKRAATELRTLQRRNRELAAQNADLQERLRQAETPRFKLTGDMPEDLRRALERAEAAEFRADDYAALLEGAQGRERALEQELEGLRSARDELTAALEDARNRPPPECPEAVASECPPPPEPECPEPQCPKPPVAECPKVVTAPVARPEPAPPMPPVAREPAASTLTPKDLAALREALARALANDWYLTAPAGEPIALEIAERLAPYEPDLVLDARQKMVKDYLQWGDEKFQAGDQADALLYGERASRVMPGAGDRLVAVVAEEKARRKRHELAGEPLPDTLPPPGAEDAPRAALPEPPERDPTLRILDGLRGVFD